MANPYAQIPEGKALNPPSPFRIAVAEKEIEDFKALLKLSKIAQPTYESLQEDGRFGVGRGWMVEAKRVWEGGFDWRKCEEHINSFPNFISTVALGHESYKIHFVALFSQNPHAVPLALFHGWPGSFLEFLPILTLLQKKYSPQTLPYHVIVPSLPGYAFSSPPPLDRDFSMKDISEIMHQLIVDLGFGDGYVAQGGDIGSRVAKVLGERYEGCKAVHINYSPVPSPPAEHPVSSLTSIEQAGIARGEEFIKMGAAYSLEHATRPSTIGLILGSNPLALLAWIGEKFLAWSDEDPSLETILESVTLYWFTETFPTSIYPYRARYLPKPIPGTTYITKPMGYSYFPKEITPTPRSWVAMQGNLVFYREHEKGGHFAALEQPELLLGDLEEFVKEVWVK